MNKDKRFPLCWITLAMIIVFFIGLAAYLTTITLSVKGDGHEYIMQTVAFQNHFSFGISPEDFEEAKVQFYNNQKGILATYTNPAAMIYDDRGWAYSNHFGAYSAIVTVVKLVLLKLNIYPLWAFSITNLILWLSAILVVFFFLNADSEKKLCIVLLLMLNPIFFYLDWVHAEMYIFAFEVIGLVFWYNKQYVRSILALSVAAMQNVGILPMAAMVGVAYVLDCYSDYLYETKKRNIVGFVTVYWRRIIPYGFLYLPAFCPIITTYLRFGVFNRVAVVAMENKYLLHKAIDYLFDPNLGIFPYEPFILIAFIVLIVLGIKRGRRDAVLNLLGIAGILFIIAHQTQINCSMQEIMRYCVWIIPIMIFYVVLNWNVIGLKKNKLLIVTALNGAFTSAIVSYCVWFGGAYSYTEFANWTKALIDIAPQIYNPTHGIFYSRTNGIEVYYYPIPVVYTNESGYVRKVLLSREAEPIFFDDSFFLMDDHGNLIEKSTLKGHRVDEGDYTYFNFSQNVKWVDRQAKYLLDNIIHSIYFSADQYNADVFVKKGISEKEEWGSWTNGNELVMSFSLNDASSPFIGINIDVGSTFYQPQSVSILINGSEVFRDIIEFDEDIDFVFENPKTETVELIMRIPDSVIPAEVMDSSDWRDLGLGLLTMVVAEVEPDHDKARVPEDGIVHFNAVEYIGNQYVISGMALPEKDGSWTLGNKMIALFTLDNTSPADTVHVSMDLEEVANGRQDISISVNGIYVFRDSVVAGENAIDFDIPYPKDGNIFMVIDIPNAVLPLEFGISDNPDEFGLMIKNIKFFPS